MENKKHTLRFRAADKDIFEAIQTDRKKIETRAATPRYAKIKDGDTLKFICGADNFEKKVKRAHLFQTIKDLIGRYSPQEINPAIISEQELEEMYYGFPGYKEKIKKCGLIALELE